LGASESKVVPLDFIELSEVIWPYRPDILIRLDFLAWYEEVGRSHFSQGETLTPQAVLANRAFFDEALRHPYLVTFTRKKRYRQLNLPRAESEVVYSEGIATFINLLDGIRAEGFDRRHRIGLSTGVFLLKPVAAECVRRPYYMGDGCHRLSCLSWLAEGRPLPSQDFRLQRKFFFRPECVFRPLMALDVVNIQAKHDFDELFQRPGASFWEDALGWAAAVRLRFRTLDLNEVLSVRIDF